MVYIQVTTIVGINLSNMSFNDLTCFCNASTSLLLSANFILSKSTFFCHLLLSSHCNTFSVDYKQQISNVTTHIVRILILAIFYGTCLIRCRQPIGVNNFLFLLLVSIQFFLKILTSFL